MKQYRFVAADFSTIDPTIPDAYIDPEVLEAVRMGRETPLPKIESKNLGKIQREQNIRPGTDAWFKLWGGK